MLEKLLSLISSMAAKIELFGAAALRGNGFGKEGRTY